MHTAIFAVSLFTAFLGAASQTPSSAIEAGEGAAAALPIIHQANHDGVSVITTIDRVTNPGAPRTLRERDDVVVRIQMTDQATHAPIRGVKPAAWLDGGSQLRPPSCRDRINVYAGGSFLGRADVDLNTFRVIAMNDDATLTVVDPLFGFGGTKLLAMIELSGVGEDWTQNDDNSDLFVTVPAAKELVRIETAGWTIARSATLPSAPHRIALQPDEGYVWTTTDDALVAVRPRDLSVAATIPIGHGRHDLVVTHDSRAVFASWYEGNTVFAIDVAKLAVTGKITVPAPVSLAWSSKSANAYVGSERGTIVAIDRRGIVATMKASPGLSTVRTVPGDRLVMAINPVEKSIDVIDVVTNAIVQSGELSGAPDQIAFSGTLAYITLRDSEEVQMIALAVLGKKGTPVPVAEVPGGQHVFGHDAGSLASRVTQVAGEGAVLFANGADKAIYYYREGMAAPMGSFSNYDRQPRAVLVVDRSLRERAPGVYETTARLAGPGSYDMALLVDAPRVVQCFAVEVAADPSRAVARGAVVKASIVVPPTPPRTGERTSLRFRIASADEKPAPPLGDTMVLVFAPGVWQSREQAHPLPDGTYSIDFTPPAAGSYSAYVFAPAAGLNYALAGTLEVVDTKQ